MSRIQTDAECVKEQHVATTFREGGEGLIERNSAGGGEKGTRQE